jgi:hypothetical protein
MTTALRIPTEILDVEVAELLKAAPGPKVITELRSISPHSLSSVGKVDYLAAIDRQEVLRLETGGLGCNRWRRAA